MLDLLTYPIQIVEANPDYDNSKPAEADWQQSWHFTHPGVDRHSQAICLLDIKAEPIERDALPYQIHLQAFATAKVENWDTLADPEKIAFEVQLRQMVTNMVRERIRTLTADAPWGAIIMPLIPIT